ncbi:MAG: MBL fold metallo-hydrolase RNA specificity domain-containing protein [Thermoproteota archaeon]
MDPQRLSIKLDRFATLHMDMGRAFLRGYSEMAPNYLFISHAHFDHLSRSSTQDGEAVCSEETFLLATLRGLKLKRASSNPFSLLDSGHILGSKAILIESDRGGILYTGDVNYSPMEGIHKQTFPKVHFLITESNYGRPDMVFPSKNELLKEIVDYVHEMTRKNRPLVLMGYPLGKLQHLQMLLDPVFQEAIETYASPSIVSYNEIYGLFSIRIDRKRFFSSQSLELPKDRCWVLYYPNVSGRNAFMQMLKRKYGAILVSFSGRSILKGYEDMLAVDKAFPLSDHADFNGLLKIVEETAPEKVFTVHGFSKEFSHELRKLGYDSHALHQDKKALIPLF